MSCTGRKTSDSYTFGRSYLYLRYFQSLFRGAVKCILATEFDV